MKTLKTGDTITISKPGLLNGSTGKIIEIDETKRKPIKALVDNGGGEWQLEYSEVQNNAPTGLKTASTKQTPPIVKEVIEFLKEVSFKEVEPAKKRGRKAKVKEVKQKRKYIRKNLA